MKRRYILASTITVAAGMTMLALLDDYLHTYPEFIMLPKKGRKPHEKTTSKAPVALLPAHIPGRALQNVPISRNEIQGNGFGSTSQAQTGKEKESGETAHETANFDTQGLMIDAESLDLKSIPGLKTRLSDLYHLVHREYPMINRIERMIEPQDPIIYETDNGYEYGLVLRNRANDEDHVAIAHRPLHYTDRPDVIVNRNRVIGYASLSDRRWIDHNHHLIKAHEQFERDIRETQTEIQAMTPDVPQIRGETRIHPDTLKTLLAECKKSQPSKKQFRAVYGSLAKTLPGFQLWNEHMDYVTLRARIGKLYATIHTMDDDGKLVESEIGFVKAKTDAVFTANVSFFTLHELSKLFDRDVVDLSFDGSHLTIKQSAYKTRLITKPAYLWEN